MVQYLQYAWQGNGPIYGDGSYKCNPIHGEDLAEFIVDTLSDPVKCDHQEITVGGPDTYTAKALVEMAYKIYRRPLQIKSLSLGSPEITTISSLVYWAHACSKQDNVGTPFGKHNLEKFLRLIYVGAPSV
jgi:nucleoside-diphosphate-sugar epimerase